MAFFCPECDWRVETFAANVDGEVTRLEDNTPRSVFGPIQDIGDEEEEDDDA
jgi:hypothetical protein